MTVPPHGEELFLRVQQASEGTPYVVQRTETGFDVTLDVADAQWYGLINKAGLTKVYVHHVAFPAPGAYTVTDDSRTLEWVAGVPRLGASAERQMGRVVEFGAKKVYALDEDGRFGAQVDYRFSSEEGRRLITGPAAQLGLELRRGGAERIGLVAAVVAIAGAVLTLVVLLAMWLTGNLG